MPCRSRLTALLSLLCLSLAAQTAPNGGKAPAAPAAATPPAPPAPGALKPFAEVIKDAKEQKGLFTLWTKEDKVWIEVKPDQLDAPFFFAISSTRGTGERGLYGGMMDDSYLASFRRVGNTLQMLAKNTTFMAPAGTPAARAVAEGFTDSLLASAPVLSQPHPDRKSFLVEANALLLRDIPMGATRLEATYRQPYGFDPSNSFFEKVRSTEDQAAFRVQAHYALQRIMLPPLQMPGAPPMPFMPPPGTLEDMRSLFLGWHFSFAKLPEQPMAPRLADDRVGYFTTTRWDFGDDTRVDPRVHHINRWRLEKKDPAAALSEPKQPIVFWLDRNIPEKYRPAITEGVLIWNKAFEQQGFKDAVQVKVQPEDAEWDTHDARHASLRWLTGTDIGFAIGPSQVDPRSGEILDADIGIGEVWARGTRTDARETLPPKAQEAFAFRHDHDQCAYAAEAHQEMGFALDLLETRGEIAPGSPEEDAYVAAVLKDVITHEVGHTLGLRHNFRASTIHSLEQISNPEYTKAHGLTGSVMDYNALNLALKGQPQGEYVMSTLGPYDHWAVEYGYRPLAPADEKAGLAKIAARSSEPQLAYGTDEEALGFGGLEGMDPEVNRRDLGSDPLAFYQKRLALSKELWERLQVKTIPAGEGYQSLRRGLLRALGQVGLSANLSAKYIGGVVHLRDHAGTSRAPLTPVPAAKQRQALKLLETGIFSVEAFKFKPEFLSRLTTDRFNGPLNPDPSPAQWVLRTQTQVLAQVFQPVVAQRILDTPDKLTNPKEAFRLSELYDTLQTAIWSELKSGREVSVMRRNLQREHLRQLSGQVIRANPLTPADSRALAREALRSLQAQLKAAPAKPGFSKETKAHFADCLAVVDESLKASLQRMSL